MGDLFDLDRVRTPSERRRAKLQSLRGYAARPGSGPEGETCKTCAHLVRHRMAKTYFKCGLVKWTCGAGTDVKAGSPACSKFQWGAIR